MPSVGVGASWIIYEVIAVCFFYLFIFPPLLGLCSQHQSCQAHIQTIGFSVRQLRVRGESLIKWEIQLNSIQQGETEQPERQAVCQEKLQFGKINIFFLISPDYTSNYTVCV